ncbi:PrsW family glutamic-type intramembrane protease, partial [[Ruminococcus] lactaris]|uniref:PrsW family glutamic-type intramembrane protease n=1 Tax=[Ruminococcus] lactaris TaxID=46228 RepID=UPI0023B189E1
IESAGYAFNWLVSTGADSVMMDITLLRGVLAVGGQVVWTAIAGAALAAAKGEEMFNIQQLISGRCLFFFAISVLLHGVWDCPLQFLGTYGKHIVLIVLAWVVILT